MGLTTCPDCEKPLSDAAPTCPHCGRPNAAAPVTVVAPPLASYGGGSIAVGCGMIVLLFGVCTMTARDASRSAAQRSDAPAPRAAVSRAPGPGWVQAIPGQDVFIHPDSITRIGVGTYSAVIYRGGTSNFLSLSTEEVQCRTLRARTVRERRMGRWSGDELTPAAEWESTPPASARATMFQAVCNLGIATTMRQR